MKSNVVVFVCSFVFIKGRGGKSDFFIILESSGIMSKYES